MSQRHAVSAFDRIRRRLPFRLAALHTDNGAEFQNAGLDGWCVRNGVARTRGRPRRSNDQAYVEQRNWTAVRRLTGDARFEGEAAREALAGLYAALRDCMNFFQPVRKVTGTERHGAKVVRRYDRGRTPYRRLLDEDDLDAETAADRTLPEGRPRGAAGVYRRRAGPSRAARKVARRAGVRALPAARPPCGAPHRRSVTILPASDAPLGNST